MSDVNEIPGGFDEPAANAVAAAAPVGGGSGAGGDSGNFDLPSFSRAIKSAGGGKVGGPIEMLKDVDLSVKIELGRTRMLIEDVLRLSEGSVVELDKLAGDPVDVYVNEQLVARGEVLVLNDNFCVRVNEIVVAGPEN